MLQMRETNTPDWNFDTKWHKKMSG